MLLYLIRHGESEANLADTDLPDAALTPLGRSQAEALARYLASESIEQVVSSSLHRALETADILARHWQAPHEVWPDLQEHRRNEPYRFMGRQQVCQAYPRVSCDEHLPHAGYDFGGETPAEGHQRALSVWQRLVARFGDGDRKVALVAHAGFNSFLLLAMLGSRRTDERGVEQSNCCVNRIRLAGGSVRLLSVNEMP